MLEYLSICTTITLIQKLAAHGCLIFSIAYKVVCVPNYSVPPFTLTPTYLNWDWLIPQLKMILIYYVMSTTSRVLIFFFSAWHFYSSKNGSQVYVYPDRFCYICGNVVLPKRQAKIIDFVKKAYCDYFRVKLGDQDTLFITHVCCKRCGELDGAEEW